MEQKEYIERDAAIKARGRSCKKNCKECDFAIDGDSWCEGEVFVVDLLRIPAADVQPVVHGRWEELPPACNGALLTRCTTCRRIMTDVELGMVKRFCPNCGAKMDLEAPE